MVPYFFDSFGYWPYSLEHTDRTDMKYLEEEQMVKEIEFYVDPEKGSDTNNDGHSKEYPLKTYQEVERRIAELVPRVTVHMLPGVYPEINVEGVKDG